MSLINYTGFNFITLSGPLTVGLTSSIIVPASNSRRYLKLHNYTNVIIWLQLGSDAAVNAGIKLIPSTSYVLFGHELYLGPIYAVSTQVCNVDVLQGSN